jgi:hypothetical protein
MSQATCRLVGLNVNMEHVVGLILDQDRGRNAQFLRNHDLSVVARSIRYLTRRKSSFSLDLIGERRCRSRRAGGPFAQQAGDSPHGSAATGRGIG